MRLPVRGQHLDTWRANTFVIAAVVVMAVAVALFARSVWPNGSAGLNEALALTEVVLIGFAATVVLMAGLAAVLTVLRLSDAAHPLGLPEGSVRALIAFSLVLIFVCLSAFIYNGLRSPGSGPGVPLKGLTSAQLEELKAQFTVAYAPVRNGDAPAKDANGQLLFDATYYHRGTKEADDFGKQVFTVIATLFASVISFYFGSSVTTSAVTAATAAQARRPPGNEKASELEASDKGGGTTTGVVVVTPDGTVAASPLATPVPRTT